MVPALLLALPKLPSSSFSSSTIGSCSVTQQATSIPVCTLSVGSLFIKDVKSCKACVPSTLAFDSEILSLIAAHLLAVKDKLIQEI